MNALRIRKRLDAPIPELPELTPWVGKELEIIVLEEGVASPSSSQVDNGLAGQTSGQERAAKVGAALIHSNDSIHGGKPKPVARFEDLLGGWPEDQLNDGFEEAVDQWRREPWRSEDPIEGTDLAGTDHG